MESVFITIKQLVMSLNRKNPVLSATKNRLRKKAVFVLETGLLVERYSLGRISSGNRLIEKSTVFILRLLSYLNCTLLQEFFYKISPFPLFVLSGTETAVSERESIFLLKSNGRFL